MAPLEGDEEEFVDMMKRQKKIKVKNINSKQTVNQTSSITGTSKSWK